MLGNSINVKRTQTSDVRLGWTCSFHNRRIKEEKANHPAENLEGGGYVDVCKANELLSDAQVYRPVSCVVHAV